MELPQSIIPYLQGLLLAHGRVTQTWLSRVLGNISHDALNRLLRKEYQIQDIILKKIQKEFGFPLVTVSIDEVTIDKLFAKKLEGASFVYSSKESKAVFGYSWVVLIISFKGISVPIYWRKWDEEDDQTRIDIAMDMLKAFRETQIPVKFIAFDSYYSAKKLIKLIQGFGWTFVTRLKRNRKVNGVQVQNLHENNIPYWTIVGELSGGIIVTVIKHEKNYFCINSRNIAHSKILKLYRERWCIEELFRVSQSKIGLNKCQSRVLKIQQNHFGLCMLAYSVLSLEKYQKEETLYSIKDDISLGLYTPNTSWLKQIMGAA